jgi:predicted transcriptional regulator
LKAGEERVITYRIKPVVNIIGTLKLPGAKVSFTLKKKKQARKSGSVLIGSYE